MHSLLLHLVDFPQWAPLPAPASMRFPKNFQPVGVSKKGTLRASATRSSAPLVGMLRATPCTAPQGHVGMEGRLGGRSPRDARSRRGGRELVEPNRLVVTPQCEAMDGPAGVWS